MITTCKICGKEIELALEPTDGQHVRCPYCAGKFSYSKPGCRPEGEEAKHQLRVPKEKTTTELGAHVDPWSVVRGAAIVILLMALAAFLYFRHEKYSKDHQAGAEVADVTMPVELDESNQSGNHADNQTNNRTNELASTADTAAMEKAETLKLLQTYLLREEQRIERIVAESKSADREISVDQQRLSAEVRRIDEVCAKRQREADDNGWRRYDKAERLLLVLKSNAINELAIKYIGEDLSALTGEFRGKMQMVVEMDKMTREGLAKNRSKYAEMVANIDDDVTSKTQVAKQQAIDANKDLEKRLTGLQEKRHQKEIRITKLQRGSQSKYVADEIGFLKNEIDVLDKEIVRFSEVVNVSRANLAHIAATEAETIARKKNDSALLVKTDEDAAVHAAAAHMRTVFDLATQYEHISLDKIRTSMKSRRELLGVRLIDAQQKLDYIRGATANSDIMDTTDLKRLRGQVAGRLQESILESTNK